jgi:DNA-binding transcriptional regulator GbsR (MarR family)
MPTKLHPTQTGFHRRLKPDQPLLGLPQRHGRDLRRAVSLPRPALAGRDRRADGLTKGAVSTEVRKLARMGLVHRSSKLGDRKDYYEAESDFYTSIRSILKERQNSEFDRAVRSVGETLEKLESGSVSGDEAELEFIRKRVKALQDFFNAIDSLAKAVIKLESLGIGNVKTILSILK